LWAAELTQPPTVLSKLARYLSPDEQARARRFVFDQDRNKYVAARGILRVLLARYLQVEPQQINFFYGSQNKPYLVDNPLFFNLAHSAKLVVYAVTGRRELGVDLEAIRPLDDMDSIARRFFAPAEYTALHAAPQPQRLRAFYNCWTRKEAFLKATGDGLTRPLNQFVVSLRSGEPARLLHLEGDPQAPQRWHLHAFSPATGYVGALAVAPAMPVEMFVLRLQAWLKNL
jgi:4'-phosphopantetheinyl transferase